MNLKKYFPYELNYDKNLEKELNKFFKEKNYDNVKFEISGNKIYINICEIEMSSKIPISKKVFGFYHPFKKSFVKFEKIQNFVDKIINENCKDIVKTENKAKKSKKVKTENKAKKSKKVKTENKAKKSKKVKTENKAKKSKKIEEKIDLEKFLDEDFGIEIPEKYKRYFPDDLKIRIENRKVEINKVLFEPIILDRKVIGFYLLNEPVLFTSIQDYVEKIKKVIELKKEKNY